MRFLGVVLVVTVVLVDFAFAMPTPPHLVKRLGLRPDFYEDVQIFCDCLGKVPTFDILDCGIGRHPWQVGSCGFRCQECPLPPGTPQEEICEGMGLLPMVGDPPDCGIDILVTVWVAANPIVYCWKCISDSCGCLSPGALRPADAETWGRIKATYR
jgi:hypothetical protein